MTDLPMCLRLLADEMTPPVIALDGDQTPTSALLREAATYIDDILLKDRGKTNEINILTRENRSEHARAKELTDALRALVAWKDAVETLAPELGGLLRAIYAAEAILMNPSTVVVDNSLARES